MIYAYKCPGCQHDFDVIKSIAQIDFSEECPKCGIEAERQIVAPNIAKIAAGAWNNQTFNAALGCYTRNDQHAARIAKSRGYEEIGNEPPEKIHAHFDRQREDTAQKRYDKI